MTLAMLEPDERPVRRIRSLDVKRLLKAERDFNKWYFDTYFKDTKWFPMAAIHSYSCYAEEQVLFFTDSDNYYALSESEAGSHLLGVLKDLYDKYDAVSVDRMTDRLERRREQIVDEYACWTLERGPFGTLPAPTDQERFAMVKQCIDKVLNINFI